MKLGARCIFTAASSGSASYAYSRKHTENFCSTEPWTTLCFQAATANISKIVGQYRTSFQQHLNSTVARGVRYLLVCMVVEMGHPIKEWQDLAELYRLATFRRFFDANALAVMVNIFNPIDRFVDFDTIPVLDNDPTNACYGYYHWASHVFTSVCEMAFQQYQDMPVIDIIASLEKCTDRAGQGRGLRKDQTTSH